MGFFKLGIMVGCCITGLVGKLGGKGREGGRDMHNACMFLFVVKKNRMWEGKARRWLNGEGTMVLMGIIIVVGKKLAKW